MYHPHIKINKKLFDRNTTIKILFKYIFLNLTETKMPLPHVCRTKPKQKPKTSCNLLPSHTMKTTPPLHMIHHYNVHNGNV